MKTFFVSAILALTMATSAFAGSAPIYDDPDPQSDIELGIENPEPAQEGCTGRTVGGEYYCLNDEEFKAIKVAETELASALKDEVEGKEFTIYGGYFVCVLFAEMVKKNKDRYELVTCVP